MVISARIRIDGISCYGYHGLLPAEQTLGQEFQVNLELLLEGLSFEKDSLDETVDYRKAVEIVHQLLEGPPQRLLETLAEKIASELSKLRGVSEVKVSVCKPHPPIPGIKGGVAVEIIKQKGT